MGSQRIAIVFGQKRNSRNTIPEVHSLLCGLGASIEAGRLYGLHETVGGDPEPQDIHNPDAAYQAVLSWPAAGWLHYTICDCSFLVEFVPDGEFAISAVVFDAVAQEFLPQAKRFRVMFSALHAALNAARTVMGEDIFAGNAVYKEIARVQTGCFEGGYELDLRNGPS